MRIRDAVGARTERRDEKEDQRCKAKLHQHVQTCHEEREVEIQVFFAKHPLVVLSYQSAAHVIERTSRAYDGESQREEVPRADQYNVDSKGLHHSSVHELLLLLSSHATAANSSV